MTNTRIASPEEQLPVLLRGTVDLNVRESFESEIRRSYKEQEPLKIKAGFDPTAPDIHLGHTVLMEKMRQFQQFGHDVIFIVGEVMHLQYFSTNELGRKLAAGDLLIDYCIHKARRLGLSLFDFGISTEEKGSIVNEESSLHASNVMLYSSDKKVVSRIDFFVDSLSKNQFSILL